MIVTHGGHFRFSGCPNTIYILFEDHVLPDCLFKQTINRLHFTLGELDFMHHIFRTNCLSHCCWDIMVKKFKDLAYLVRVYSLSPECRFMAENVPIQPLNRLSRPIFQVTNSGLLEKKTNDEHWCDNSLGEWKSGVIRSVNILIQI